MNARTMLCSVGVLLASALPLGSALPAQTVNTVLSNGFDVDPLRHRHPR